MLLSVVLEPAQANHLGSVHGGVVLKLCDDVAGAAGARHARRHVVTAAVDRVTFLGPVRVGELLVLTAEVTAAWRTSMEVMVDVRAEDLLTGESRRTNSALVTMVAVDADGRPAPIPPLARGTAGQEAERAAAEARRASRLAERTAEAERLHRRPGSAT